MADTRRRAPSPVRSALSQRRLIVIVQPLIALVAVLGVLVELWGNAFQLSPQLIVGLAVLAIATVVAAVVPWDRIPVWWSAFLPAMDILAIALIRQSTPNWGFAVLWIFPVIWASWSFGWVGAFASAASVCGVYVSFVALSVVSPTAASVLLLPLTMTGAAVVTAMVASRGGRQTALLARQSASLRDALDRAEQQENVLGSLLDAVDFGVVLYDTDGREVRRNRAFDEQGRLVRLGSRRVYADDGVTELLDGSDPISKAKAGIAFERELVWYGAPGEARRVFSMSSRALDASGTVLVTHDVTAQELALRAREDLVAAVSHELRTPLTSIVGYIEFARDAAELPQSAARNLDIAARNADRLLQLVTDILSESTRTRTGVQLKIERQRVDVGELVRSTVDDLRSRGIAVGITIDDSGVRDVEAFVDPKRLRQIVDNLISNAIKYGRPGGHVEVACRSDRESVRIVVRDDGRGIPAAELGMVFDQFFRSQAVRGGTQHGYGLGLWISKDIARAHGGDISVESTEGVGSTFTVHIPLGDLDSTV